MSKITIITSSSDLDNHIGKLKGHAAKFEAMVQVALASATLQAFHHGNTNHINAVLAAMGKGARKQAAGAWLTAFAPVVPETDREKMKEHPFRFSRDRMAELAAAWKVDVSNIKAPTAEEALALAEVGGATLWTEHKEPPIVPEKWDVKAALLKVIATAKQMQGKKVDVQNADLLGKLADLLPADKDAIQGV